MKLLEVFLTFLKFGSIGFGGPLAHTALFREHFVEEKKWVSEEQFLESLSLTQMIPGPNSTELAMHLGYMRAGWLGFLLAGFAFIFPACFFVYLLAIFFLNHGGIEDFSKLVWAMKPIIAAIILVAIFRMKGKAFTSFPAICAGLGGFIASLFGASDFSALLCALFLSLLFQGKRWASFTALSLSFAPLATPWIPGFSRTIQISPLEIFRQFFEMSSMVFGSGYVLYGYIEKRFAQDLGWINHEALLASISAGQLTPGPLFSTATFLGYILQGKMGALAATLGIFLPSFLFGGLAIVLAAKLRTKDFWKPSLEALVCVCFLFLTKEMFALLPSLLPSTFSYLFFALSILAITWLRVSSTFLLFLGLGIGYLSSFFL